METSGAWCFYKLVSQGDIQYMVSWEDRLRELRAYKKKYGHCNVPAGWPQYKSLARWVAYHRNAKKRGVVREERIRRLDRLGFEWTPHVTVWNKRFGNCNVPQEWDENPLVGRWVAAQRRRHRVGRMSRERINRLNSLGFQWELGE